MGTVKLPLGPACSGSSALVWQPVLTSLWTVIDKISGVFWKIFRMSEFGSCLARAWSECHGAWLPEFYPDWLIPFPNPIVRLL